MILRNASVYTEAGTFVQKEIYITGESFTETAAQDDAVMDATGYYAIPGLTDLHFHGCMGHDFCDGSLEAMDAIAQYQAQNGVTTICPATMTLAEEVLAEICACAAVYHDSTQGAALVGINLEGPFLSLAKKGAQNAAYLHKPDAKLFHRLQKAAGGLIKLLAIAPEEENAMEMITALKEEVILSIAHTTADYETACKAFACGASHVTHLYNAMPPFSHRAPGVVGAAFDAPHASVELICDGIHIHPSVVRSTFQLFGEDRIILISDSMMAAGMPNGQYSLGGQAVTVLDGLATLSDGTIAGSATNLFACMRTAVQKMGIPLTSAVKCAAVNPAKALGIYSDYGSITPGKYANLLLLDQSLHLKTVILKGKEMGVNL